MFGNAVILAAIKKKRFTVKEFRTFNFGNHNRVIACNMKSGKFAGKLAKNIFKQRNFFLSPVKHSADSLLHFRILIEACEKFRPSLLLSLQHIDAEPLLLFQQWQHSRAMIHTNGDQRRLKRNRRKGIRRHPVNMSSFALHSNHGHARGKMSQRAAKFG